MNSFEKFYNSALRFLSYRPRSEKEVRDKLKIKNVKPQIIEKIIAKLKRYNFINDLEFAKKWIDSRMRFKPRSVRLIKLELKQRGIAQDSIDRMIDDQGLMIDDLESAKNLVEKRIGRFKGLDRQEVYQKLGRYLASKGFGWGTIKKAVDEMLDKGV